VLFDCDKKAASGVGGKLARGRFPATGANPFLGTGSFDNSQAGSANPTQVPGSEGFWVSSGSARVRAGGIRANPPEPVLWTPAIRATGSKPTFAKTDCVKPLSSLGGLRALAALRESISHSFLMEWHFQAQTLR